jgi:hypothetical protein
MKYRHVLVYPQTHRLCQSVRRVVLDGALSVGGV